MLKTRLDGQILLVSQPDHAVVSGYLAAHWGNEEFARPGYFAPCPDPESVCAETVFAIAEHDNGWWEWEADPDLDPADGLPLHLTSMSQQEGFARWRLGVPRFQAEHPYVALLISLHAYWLYAFRCESGLDTSFHHPLFGDLQDWPAFEGEPLERASRFVAEQKQIQRDLIGRLKRDRAWAAAVEPELLDPHVRLLQLADALSLALCFGGQEELSFPNIPRQSWDDRVTLGLSADGMQRVVCDPYPFDTDPLPVLLRARVLDEGFDRPEHFQSWWHSVPRTTVRFEFATPHSS